MDKLEQMMTTVDIAEMSHKNILRKIEGREIDGKYIKGVIDILNELHLNPVNDTYLGGHIITVRS